jgi:hypothetical protein
MISDPVESKDSIMKTTIMLTCGVAILCAAGACRSRGSHESHWTQGPAPTYVGTTVVAEPAMPPTAAVPAGKAFPTPQAAIDAVAQAAGAHDKAKVEELFGPGATEVIWSGDDNADREAGLKVKELIQTKVSFDEQTPERVVADLGKDEWPFPIPLVKSADGWRFDLEAGRDELLNRRIGRNELHTIETMYEYVDAQKEYFAKGRDGNPQAYAQKVRSAEGKHDGLFWESAQGEEQSPLGPLVVEARKSGYGPAGDDTPEPFHGYYYKILTGQGANPAGGRKSYLDAKGLMTKGFAAVAWPASYGNSGIKTFVVSQTGIVFEKDLGKDTGTLAAAISEYDPDRTWLPSPQPVLDDDDK